MSAASPWTGGRAWTPAEGRAAGAGLTGRPWVFRAVAGAQGSVSVPGLLDFRGPGTEARRAGMPQPAA